MANGQLNGVKRTVLVASQVFLPSDGHTLFETNTTSRQPFTGCKVEVPLRGVRVGRGPDSGAGSVFVARGGADALASNHRARVTYSNESIIVGFDVETRDATDDSSYVARTVA